MKITITLEERPGGLTVAKLIEPPIPFTERYRTPIERVARQMIDAAIQAGATQIHPPAVAPSPTSKTP